MSRKLVVAVVILSLCAGAQESAPKVSPAAPAKPKSKKVYTEEDLGKLRGGVSVVGEPAQPKAEASSVPLDEDEAESVPADKAKPPAKKRVTASNCRSASWAKIVALVVQQQGLYMQEGFWHEKLFGNPFCIENVGSIEKITQSIQGDYTMDTGDRLRVAVKVSRPWPDPEVIVPNHQKGDVLIVVWKGQPYYVESIDTIEYVVKGHDTGLPGLNEKEIKQHIRWVIKRFRLVDPDMGNTVFFENGKDTAADINGSLYLTVSRR